MEVKTRSFRKLQPLTMLILGDPFASFFGDFGFNFGGDERRNEVHKGANVVIDLFASLEEMYSGNFVEVK